MRSIQQNSVEHAPKLITQSTLGSRRMHRDSQSNYAAALRVFSGTLFYMHLQQRSVLRDLQRPRFRERSFQHCEVTAVNGSLYSQARVQALGFGDLGIDLGSLKVTGCEGPWAVVAPVQWRTLWLKVWGTQSKHCMATGECGFIYALP